jgi:hypothetical protein
MTPTHLTSAEIDELCMPLKQRAAQTRYLCQLLGVKTLPRRPDGLPIVGREQLAAHLSGRATPVAAANGIRWSKAA